MKNAHPNSEGYIVLITVLILGVAATTVAVFLLVTGTNSTLASSGVVAHIDARAGAEACAELALGSIQSSPTLVTPATGNSTVDASTQDACTYSISGTSPDYTILAEGTVRQNTDNYVHRLTIITNQVTPNITIQSWQDTP